jgi:four helix bundle protein
MATVDLNELRVYQLAMRVGEDVWSFVDGWPWMAKQSVGLQWIRSADSIAANIAEGYGRYSFKENTKFCYHARGSLRESQTWLTKAKNRSLIPTADADDLSMKFETLRRQLDNYTHSLGKPSSSTLRESSPDFFDQVLPSLEDFLAAHDSTP